VSVLKAIEYILYFYINYYNTLNCDN